MNTSHDEYKYGQVSVHLSTATGYKEGDSSESVWRKVEPVPLMYSHEKKANYAMVILSVVMFLHFAPNVKAQVSDERARDMARETVRSSTQRANTFFSVHRREDLEDVFYSVRSFPHGIFQRDPQIFEVSDEGYEFKNNSIRYHLNVRGPFVYFVAVPSGSSDVFRIAGFKDAQKEFNRLAKTYQVKLRNESEVRDYTDFYLQVDPLHYRVSQIPSLLLLKQLAERKFAENYEDLPSAEFHFDRWWNKYKSALARLSFTEKIVTTERGFVATFLTLSGIDKNSPNNGPVPLRVTLTLSKDGQIEEPTFAPILRR